MFFQPLPNHKRKEKSQKNLNNTTESNNNNPSDSLESSESEHLSPTELFDKITMTSKNDEFQRKEEFSKQKKILKLIECFFWKTSSYVKQKGLADQRKINEFYHKIVKSEKIDDYFKEKRVNEYQENINKMDFDVKSDREKSKIQEKTNISIQKEEKQKKIERGKKINVEYEKVKSKGELKGLIREKVKQFDVFFDGKRKKERKRFKLKIF